MPERPCANPLQLSPISRREWLTASSLAWLCVRSAAASADVATDTRIAAIEAKGKEAGLSTFRHRSSERYVAVGDAPDAYCAQALKICEELATTYQKHFRERKFAVEFPNERLTIITLKDKQSYSAFLGEAPGADVGGHYEIDANWLVIFDFRPDADNPAPNAKRINTFTLVHEAFHQLTFNTGQLDRKGDVPLCISEGLAAYGERWLPPWMGKRSGIGLLNQDRLAVIRSADADRWIPLETLLTKDDVFGEDATVQLAYAQSWLLVYYAMKPSSRLPQKFRSYLEVLKTRRDPKQRLDDARAQLGNLERLDRDLRHHAGQL